MPGFRTGRPDVSSGGGPGSIWDNLVFTRAGTKFAQQADGTYAWAPINLVPQSQTFTAPWGGQGTTPPTQTGPLPGAPDGTATSTQLAYPAISAGGDFSLLHSGALAVTNGATYTLSMWIKGTSGSGTLYLSLFDTTWRTLACAYTTEWQRFTLTVAVIGATADILIGVDLRDAVQSAKPAQTVQVWGAMLNPGASAAAYIRTTTTANAAPIFGPKGLLIEPAITNMIVPSQAFQSWTLSGATITPDAVPAPDGTLTADTLTATADTVSGGTIAVAYLGFGTTVIGQQYTLSVWAKAGTYDKIDIACNNGSTVTHNTFQLTSQWARYSATFTAQATFIYAEVGWLGTHSVAGKNAHIWGYQVEAGTVVHSYVPTTTLAVTCPIDKATLPAALLTVGSGRWTFDFTPQWNTGPPANARLLDSVDAAHGNSGIQLLVLNTTGINTYTVNSTGVADTANSAALPWVAGQTYRFEFVYGAGAHTLSRDGVVVATTAATHLPDYFGALHIGTHDYAGTAGDPGDGWFNAIRVKNRDVVVPLPA